METLKSQIESLVSQGYRLAAAQAKVAHDAILLAMNRCGFKAHSTIKGVFPFPSLQPRQGRYRKSA